MAEQLRHAKVKQAARLGAAAIVRDVEVGELQLRGPTDYTVHVKHKSYSIQHKDTFCPGGRVKLSPGAAGAFSNTGADLVLISVGASFFYKEYYALRPADFCKINGIKGSSIQIGLRRFRRMFRTYRLQSKLTAQFFHNFAAELR